MTTVGGSLALPLPPFGLEGPPEAPNRGPIEPALATPEGWAPEAGSAALARPALIRASLRVAEEEVGVRTGDWSASRADGDAAPSLTSLFFLEDLVASLPRESCGKGDVEVSAAAVAVAEANGTTGTMEGKDSQPSG